MSNTDVARPPAHAQLDWPVEGQPILWRHVTCKPSTAIATVLVVEDDGHCRAGLRRHLVRAGFDVCEAANGLEALHVLNRQWIDVLATDIRMPTMSGLALVDVLASDRPDLPVIAYSGAVLLDPGLRRQLSARNVPLLFKPFPVEELVEALLRALDRDKQ